MPATKADLRIAIRQRRAALTPAEVTVRSRQAIAHLRTCAPVKSARQLACFMALPHEVQTQDFVAACVAEGRQVCVPCQAGPGQGYVWTWITTATLWRQGTMGIAEPVNIQPVDSAGLEVVIVPAVAVDAAGNRLGHGGGHYDRLLAHYTGPRVGLIFEYQRVPQIPAMPHDVPLTGIVTESGYFTFEPDFPKQPKQENKGRRVAARHEGVHHV